MTKTKETKTYLEKVVERLSKLKVSESFDKQEFVKETWGDNTFFQIRSFDVYYSKAKRLIKHKTFTLRSGHIYRTK